MTLTVTCFFCSSFIHHVNLCPSCMVRMLTKVRIWRNQSWRKWLHGLHGWVGCRLHSSCLGLRRWSDEGNISMRNIYQLYINSWNSPPLTILIAYRLYSPYGKKNCRSPRIVEVEFATNFFTPLAATRLQPSPGLFFWGDGSCEMSYDLRPLGEVLKGRFGCKKW